MFGSSGQVIEAQRQAPRVALGLTADALERLFEQFEAEAAATRAASLRVAPGGDLAAALQALTVPERLTDLDDDGLVSVVVAAERLGRWAASVRGEGVLARWERWSYHDPTEALVAPATTQAGGRDEQAGQARVRARARRLKTVAWAAIRRWTSTHATAEQVATAEQMEAADLAESFVATEVSLACGVSRTQAHTWLDVARALTEPDRLPLTGHALRLGSLEWAKALEVVRATRPLGTGTSAAVEALVVPRAVLPDPELPSPGIDTDEIRTRARPARSPRRRRPGPGPGRRRRQSHHPPTQPSGPDLPPRRNPRPPRSRTPPGRLRPRPTRAPAHITVLIGLETLLGLCDDPAHLEGYGPIAAQMARDLATNGIWRCAATDDTHSTILGLGTATYNPRYTPGPDLRRLTEATYPHCARPGCRARATRCDVDHITPWPDGPTCSCNGQPLCRRDHRLKTTGLLHVQTSRDPAHPPGTLIWTTRTRRRYLTTPPPPLTPLPTPFPVEPPPRTGQQATSGAAPEPAPRPSGDDPPPF
jgi:hypothetical protein